MKTKFALSDLKALNLSIDKTWFYRNCQSVNTRMGINAIENVYTIVSVQKALARKREELIKNYSADNKMRQKAELKLRKIEDAVNKFYQEPLANSIPKFSKNQQRL